MPGEKLTIAIIGGTGKEGRGLALRWASASYQVIIGSRQAERAVEAANDLNNKLGNASVIGLENADAVKMADICVLTVNPDAHQTLLDNLREGLHGKILVDATSRVDYRDPKPPLAPSAAEQAQKLLGDSVRVVGAFQNVPAKSLSTNIGQQIDADVLVCSDDEGAANQVIELANKAGLRGYYGGKLANSIIVEGLTSILTSINKRYGIKDARIKIIGLPEQD